MNSDRHNKSLLACVIFLIKETELMLYATSLDPEQPAPLCCLVKVYASRSGSMCSVTQEQNVQTA